MKNSGSPTYNDVINDVRNNSITVNGEVLERIKAKFSHIINSNRAMYYVRTLKDLVNLLEQRAIDGRDQEEFSAALVECVKLPKTERLEACASSQNDQEIPRHVMDMIADKIGRKWWDMARYLDISEETIQEIEGRYRFSLKQQAYQALLTFCNQPINEGKISKLLNALEDARRVDLKTKVERELSKKNGLRKNYRL